ncbi:MAG TPA: hypothetical protein PLH07_01545 [Sulfurovum sp.]|jgi:PII-like signaling protein|nr:hypothetical protein [Sulfurovum sp.]HQS72043.1 hypothetical protein [Sulfurovum sp.]HQS78604.1 hypothetical protein [Sulfurovum sp.]HQT27961.1 hypothetical protein [Sulfurovum sp.]
MQQMKKVELIFESVYENRLLELFKKHEINGYTIIRDIEGYGGHGLKTADDVSDIFSNIYIFAVCESHKYDDMDKDIRIFLARHGGKCILSDVMLLLGTPKK